MLYFNTATVLIYTVARLQACIIQTQLGVCSKERKGKEAMHGNADMRRAKDDGDDDGKVASCDSHALVERA